MDAELRELLLGIGNRLDPMNCGLDGMDKRLDTLGQTVVGMAVHMQEMTIAQAVMAGRLDEQRSVLAALIPARIAAVPAAA